MKLPNRTFRRALFCQALHWVIFPTRSGCDGAKRDPAKF